MLEVAHALDERTHRVEIVQLLVGEGQLDGVDAHLLGEAQLFVGGGGAHAVDGDLRQRDRAGLVGAQRHGGDGLHDEGIRVARDGGGIHQVVVLDEVKAADIGLLANGFLGDSGRAENGHAQSADSGVLEERAAGHIGHRIGSFLMKRVMISP